MNARLVLSVALVALLGSCQRTGDHTTAAASTATADAATTSAAAASSPPPAALPSTKPRVSRLRLITYNVLASRVFGDLRLAALGHLLGSSEADVIALQEVAPWMIEPLTQASWVTDGYRVTRRGDAPFAPGGQLILSRHPIVATRALALPGKQRRTALLTEIQLGDEKIAVATTHLESFLEDGPTRARQLDVIFERLRPYARAVLLGDLNFGDGEQPETDHLRSGYLDLWRQVHPEAPGFTWDIEGNPLARLGAFTGEPSRRLDRILMRAPGWTVRSVSIIGDEKAGERVLRQRDRVRLQPPDRLPADATEPTVGVFPSDHYGLMAEVAAPSTLE